MRPIFHITNVIGRLWRRGARSAASFNDSVTLPQMLSKSFGGELWVRDAHCRAGMVAIHTASAAAIATSDATIATSEATIATSEATSKAAIAASAASEAFMGTFFRNLNHDTALLQLRVALWTAQDVGAKSLGVRKKLEEGYEIIYSGKYDTSHGAFDPDRLLQYLNEALEEQVYLGHVDAHPENRVFMLLSRLLNRDSLGRRAPDVDLTSLERTIDVLLAV